MKSPQVMLSWDRSLFAENALPILGWSRWTRRIFIFLLTFCICNFGWAGESRSVIDRLIFPVPKSSYNAQLPNLVQLPSKGNKKIPALWLENSQAKWVIVYFHGNGMDIGHCRPWAEFMQKQGYAVLAVEYPGYGISQGTPSEKGCYAAANAAYEYLRTGRGIPAEKIILYGMSLGTGVATDLAARKPVGAVILESPFLSTFRVVTGVKLASDDRFDNAAKIGKIKCPLLIIHGTADRVVPYSHGTQLYDAAINVSRKQFYKIEGGGHGNLWIREKNNLPKTIEDFLANPAIHTEASIKIDDLTCNRIPGICSSR